MEPLFFSVICGIHHWTDDQCLTILENCRRAMKPDGRLLIIENGFMTTLSDLIEER